MGAPLWLPQPGRDSFGERSYPLAQVEKLRIIKRLLDAGHRPGQVVAMSVEQLQSITESLLAGPMDLTRGKAGLGGLLDEAMRLLRAHEIDGLRSHLHQAVASLGSTVSSSNCSRL